MSEEYPESEFPKWWDSQPSLRKQSMEARYAAADAWDYQKSRLASAEKANKIQAETEIKLVKQLYKAGKENQQLTEENKRLREALKYFVDDRQCSFDSRGYCLTHYRLECRNQEGLEALKEKG